MNYHGICLFAGHKTLRKTKKWYPIPNLCNSRNSCIAEGGRSDIPCIKSIIFCTKTNSFLVNPVSFLPKYQ